MVPLRKPPLCPLVSVIALLYLFILGFILDAVDETHHGMFQCDASSMYNDKQYGPASATIDVDVKCMKDLLMVIIQTFFF